MNGAQDASHIQLKKTNRTDDELVNRIAAREISMGPSTPCINKFSATCMNNTKRYSDQSWLDLSVEQEKDQKILAFSRQRKIQ